jgi:hypothetical protein
MHSQLDLKLAAELHRVRSAARPFAHRSTRSRRRSERTAPAVAPAVASGDHGNAIV